MSGSQNNLLAEVAWDMRILGGGVRKILYINQDQSSKYTIISG